MAEIFLLDENFYTFGKLNFYNQYILTLETSIEWLKGIGAERAKLIGKVLEISTLGDLLSFYPIRYIDKSKIYTIAELQKDTEVEVQLRGKISELTEVPYGKGQKRLVAKFRDHTGTLDLVWFRYTQWMVAQFPVNKEVFLFGKVNWFNGTFSMPHPEIEIDEKKAMASTLLPVYSGSEKLVKRGINNKLFQNVITEIIPQLPHLMPENLPKNILESLKLIPRHEAYRCIHFPRNIQELKEADRRLKFEEAFFFQLGYGLKKQFQKTHYQGIPFPKVGAYFNTFYQKYLPFQLTNAQKRVLKEIRNDMRKPIQMNRLLQGDVGSGKTMVALLSMLLALDNEAQACLMAPTEILAQQHYNSIKELLAQTDIEVALLTGSTKTAERKEIHTKLKNGTLSILVGTHAVLEEVVQFKNLGLAIIDEQHRFGVAQRAKLWTKNHTPPHILVMTATPIPRTLAMSFYSDLDVSIIDELPMGRKPIITAHRREKDRLTVYQFAKEEIKKGRQVYFVYPLIEESETLDYKNLQEGLDQVMDFFKDYQTVMLHGKMKPQEKEAAMQYFASGNAQIMVATTVIEVGVNVPNASVMIIESAERFGLSQLHQLRGRVGRGAEQSFCILMTSDKLSAEGRKRIRTMCETNDGFRISEVDMELRGPGDILGTQQSGIVDFKRLDLVKDAEMIKLAQSVVVYLMAKDPHLQAPEHIELREYYRTQYKGRNKWGKIS